jgi:hypothetical protein
MGIALMLCTSSINGMVIVSMIQALTFMSEQQLQLASCTALLLYVRIAHLCIVTILYVD